MTCCFTSFTYSYLAQARVLVESLRSAHPNWHLVAVVVDESPIGGNQDLLEGLFDEIISVGDLGIPNMSGWLFKHDIVEACTAVKGHALLLLLESHDKVVYLDPDIAIFHPLTDLELLLDEHSIILTPHQVSPNEKSSVFTDNEATSMRYGIYNLGFLAVRSDMCGYAFARWWSQQLYRACYDEIERGVFTDQKYCDLVPALFDRVCIQRNPGWNVASWNISRRLLSVDVLGEIRSQGQLLCFYHFTKVGKDGDLMTARYAAGNYVALEIWEWYKREIERCRVPWVPNNFWAFGQFDDGTLIPKALRVLFRQRTDLMKAFPNPYAQSNSFLSWARSNHPELLSSSKID